MLRQGTGGGERTQDETEKDVSGGRIDVEEFGEKKKRRTKEISLNNTRTA